MLAAEANTPFRREGQMHLIRHAVIAATIIATTLVLPARAETVKLTFLLTNDIYKVDNTWAAVVLPGSMPW